MLPDIIKLDIATVDTAVKTAKQASGPNPQLISAVEYFLILRLFVNKTQPDPFDVVGKYTQDASSATINTIRMFFVINLDLSYM
jgi:hypothetical protein